MKNLISIVFCLSFITIAAIAQQKDTLTFYSGAFGAERSIYITTPEFHKYAASAVQCPVVFLLDAQHEWFANPVHSDIRYLQYAHEIPQCIVVEIPLENRVKECGIVDLKGADLPLHTFITEEVVAAIEDYNPGGFRVVIGHSFSASFALYSYLKAPDFYSAVLAHSPLDELEKIVAALENSPKANPDLIYISTGSSIRIKDSHHRKAFDSIASRHPVFFEKINTYSADFSAHNGLPIVATPHFLSRLFLPFSIRYMEIAPVDENYSLSVEPAELEEEIDQIKSASLLGRFPYPPELPEVNGIASRYANSGYDMHAKAVYEYGAELYPTYFDFPLLLCEYYLESEPEIAQALLKKGEELLIRDTDLEGREEILSEIAVFKSDMGWE